ncbi:DNA-binding domain-containing protein, partial [Pseudomonas aeruginosa]
GLGESAGVGQDAEEFLHTPAPATAATSIPSPAPAPAPTPGSSATKPSGEQFMVWLKQGIASRRLIINDAKALVHTVNDTAYLVSPG